MDQVSSRIENKKSKKPTQIRKAKQGPRSDTREHLNSSGGEEIRGHDCLIVSIEAGELKSESDRAHKDSHELFRETFDVVQILWGSRTKHGGWSFVRHQEMSLRGLSFHIAWPWFDVP